MKQASKKFTDGSAVYPSVNRRDKWVATDSKGSFLVDSSAHVLYFDSQDEAIKALDDIGCATS